MNFTREPIIETIITPKDGFKLVVKNSKGKGSEEYSVEALEVVSFGGAIFYRSCEKPKSFLLPVSDFEVIEMRESKVVLKNASIDKTIKIAGGKESKSQDAKKSDEKKDEAPAKKKRTRKNKATSDKKVEKSEEATPPAPASAEGELLEPTHIKSLIPPPSTLISETISRYKTADEDGEGVVLPETVEAAMEMKQKRPAEGEAAPEVIDPIWVDEPPVPKAPASNKLKKEEKGKKPIKLAPPPEPDEPIGETHAEECLPKEEAPLEAVSETADDQK